MTRIAILSDIHGNTLALRAVLAEIQASGGVDETWFLGDYAAIGYDPVGVLKQLADLPNTRMIRGNTEYYISTGEQPWPKPEHIQSNPETFMQNFRVWGSLAWTAGAVATAGWLPWMSALPLDFRQTLADGTRLLAVHASPGMDDGTGIHPYMTEEEIRPLLSRAEADLILVGHTHLPFDRRVDGVRLVNPGSVSNPLPPDLRASYAILESHTGGYQIDFHRVDYDYQAVMAATLRVQHPAAEYIGSFFQGLRVPDWLKPHLD